MRDAAAGAAVAHVRARFGAAPRWVLGDPAGLAGAWASRLDDPAVHPIFSEAPESGEPFEPEAWPQVADVQAIDLFCDWNPEDPTGERAVSRLVAFIQSLVPCRIDDADCPCRVTVVTRKAALDAEDARGSALWGAVRSLAFEIAEEAKLDFRLVDLGTADDLETLAWLARNDLRERELAVRAGRLWVPRVVSNRELFPRVSAGEDPPYRLFLDNAGQIAGLQMKTCEPPAPGPHHVEIDVAAAALNFRDVMVTLGLLPELAYERSAFGHEVGMEASGVVRRAGVAVEGLEPGDEVVFVDSGCIANRVVVGQHRVFPKAHRAQPGGGRIVTLGLRHRLLRPDSPGPAAQGAARPHSLGHGRHRAGRHRARQRRGCGGLRHGRQREQTHAAPGVGRQGSLRFPQ